METYTPLWIGQFSEPSMMDKGTRVPLFRNLKNKVVTTAIVLVAATLTIFVVAATQRLSDRAAPETSRTFGTPRPLASSVLAEIRAVCNKSGEAAIADSMSEEDDPTITSIQVSGTTADIRTVQAEPAKYVARTLVEVTVSYSNKTHDVVAVQLNCTATYLGLTSDGSPVFASTVESAMS